MLLLSPIVTNLQWNGLYNLGFLNKIIYKYYTDILSKRSVVHIPYSLQLSLAKGDSRFAFILKI